jgi:hypothetical protein
MISLRAMKKLLMVNFSDPLFVEISSTPLHIRHSVDELGTQLFGIA